MSVQAKIVPSISVVVLVGMVSTKMVDTKLVKIAKNTLICVANFFLKNSKSIQVYLYLSSTRNFSSISVSVVSVGPSWAMYLYCSCICHTLVSVVSVEFKMYLFQALV